MTSNLFLVSNFAPIGLEALTLNLARFGYTLLPVHNVAEIKQHIQQNPSLAVMVDISTPEFDGMAICRQIKGDFPQLPVIALNANEPALRKAAYAAGADTVMDFPLEAEHVRDWLTASPNERIGPYGNLLGATPAQILGSTGLLGHDLKSPVSLMISSLEVLIAMNEEDESMELTTRLLRGTLQAAHRQINLINDLIDLARLEQGDYELEKRPINLVALLEDTFDAHESMLKTKELNVTLDFSADKLTVDIDPDLLTRAVTAMIDNVIKFTIHDDIFIVRAFRTTDKIVVTFTDGGRPVAPGYERQIMTRASQWEGRQSGTRTSVGMGLPFIYRVALAHHGDFTALSDLSTGHTTFTLTLPAHNGGTSHG